jgi:transposase
MYVGVDVHKHSLYVCYYRRAEEYAFRSFAFTSRGFGQFLESLCPSDEVAIESVTQAAYLVEQLSSRVQRVVVVNTFAFDVIKRSRAKTDAKDAFLLAQHLSYGHLPEVHLPPRVIRDLRSYLQARTALVQERTRLKNRIHATFLMHGIVTARRHLDSRRGREALRAESLGHAGYPEMDLVPMHLDRIDQIEAHIAAIEAKMVAHAGELPDLPRLLEVRGISHVLGIAILAEVGDFRRFHRAAQLSSYAGLVPGTRRSGGKTRDGRAGFGRKGLRTALIQAARSLVTHEPENPLAIHYQDLKRRRGAGRASVAVARKLLEVLWIMVTEGRPFHQMDSGLHQLKLKRIGLAA